MHTNSGTKFARLGARVVKDDVGQIVDLKPFNGTVRDANFWANMPGETGATGAVALKYHPGTAAGDATRAMAEQAALGASTTGELMSVIVPVRRRPMESRLALETSKARPSSRATSFYVPYGSKRRDQKKGCENCGSPSHKTGACPRASHVHGDTPVCPFCNVLSEVHMLDSENVFSHNAEGRLVVRGCATLAQAWGEDLVRHIFAVLVVGRLRKPVLRVRNMKNSIFELVFLMADTKYRGKMPREMGGKWPYTKEDAVRYARELERFDEIGLENMPKSSLEAMTFAEIREAYNNGQISPQIYGKNERISRGVFAKRPSAEDKGKGKELADDCGNAEMVGDHQRDAPVEDLHKEDPTALMAARGNAPVFSVPNQSGITEEDAVMAGQETASGGTAPVVTQSGTTVKDATMAGRKTAFGDITGGSVVSPHWSESEDDGDGPQLPTIPKSSVCYNKDTIDWEG